MNAQSALRQSAPQPQRRSRLCFFLPAILLALLPLTAPAAGVWIGGDTTNLTTAAGNWDAGVPAAGSALTFSNTSPIGTTLVWNFSSGQNSPSVTFVSGALGYTFNDPATATLIQLVPVAGAGGITNNSTSNQTFNKEINVFFNGTKGFNAASGNLTIGKKVRFRSDSMTSGQTNILELTGGQNGSITVSPAVDDNSAPAAGAGYLLSKTGAGTWTINGAISTASTTTSLKVSAGTLTLNPGVGTTSAVGNVRTTGGALNLNSGTMTVTSTGGAGTGIGLFVNGGTMTVAGGAVSTTGYLTVAGGTLAVSSGAVTNNTDLLNAYGAAGTVTLSGSGLMNLVTFRVAHSAGAGTVNLNGGTLMLNNFEANGGGTINFNGTTVQAKANQAAFSPTNNTAIVKAGGAIFDSSIYNITVASPLLAGTPSGGLTKLGSGTLTLSTNNTYTNVTLINVGKLVGAVGGSCSNSAVSVAATAGNTATLGVSITDTNKQWTCSSLTVNNAGTSSGLDFDFGALTPSTTLAPLNVTNDITFTTAPAIAVHSTSLPVSAGNGYPLLTWGAGAAPSLAGITLALPSHAVGSLAVVGNTLYLQVTAPPAQQPMSWTGGNGTWDVNNSGNIIWQSSDAVATYYQEAVLGNDQVVFDNTIGSGGTVTLNTTVSPASVTVTNPTADYTITGSGAIAGGTALTKQGAGTLTLSTPNTYTGGTVISAGTLKPGVANAIPAGTALTINGGALDVNGQTLTVSPLSGTGGSITNTGSLTVSNKLTATSYAGVITGNGTLTKSGTNTLTLSGVNTLTGPVLVTAGSLQLGGGLTGTLSSASSITVTNSAQLVYTTTAAVTNDAPLTLSGNGIGTSIQSGQQIGALELNGNGGSLYQNGAITLAPTNTGGVVRIGAFGTTSTLTLNGVISGNAALSLWAQGGASTHNGWIFINNNFAYTGNTSLDAVAANNLTTLGVDNALPPTTVLTLGAYAAGGITNYSQLILNGHQQTLAGLSSTVNMNNIVTNRITGGSATLSTLTISNAVASTYVGVLGGTNVNDNNLALVKADTGTLILTRENTYAGGTLIGGGVLQLGDATAASVVGNITNNGALTLKLSGNPTFGNQISGSGSLTNLGAGTITLTNVNTFTGGTTLAAGNFLLNSSSGECLASDITISSGNLQLGAAEQITNTAVLTFATNTTGRFQLQGFNETIGGVQSLGGTGVRIVEAAADGQGSKPATLTLNVSGAAVYSYDSYVRDAAGAAGSPISVTKSGPGTQIFSAANALVNYSGATIINDGVLEFSGASATANLSPMTLNGGSIKFSGGGTRSALISGPGNLINASTANLALSGNNTYAGVTTLGAGTLVIPALADGGVNSPIGAATSDAANLVFAGGNLYYSSATNAGCNRSFTILGTNTATIVVANALANVTLTGNSPATSGYLKKIGNGILTLDPGAGSYSVGALSADAGQLILKSGTFTTTGADPFSPAYAVGAGARGGTLVVDGATLNITGGGMLKPGTSTVNGNLDILTGTVNVGDIVLGHNASAVATQSGGTVTVTNLYHQDGGNATNTISGGTLTARRIFNNTAATNNYFTLILNGGTVRAATGTANLMDNRGLGGVEMAVQLGTNGVTIDTTLSDAKIARPLDDLPGEAGQLTKIGSGTLTLSSNNTYTGSTTVSNGTLRVNGAISTGTVAARSGGTLGGHGTIGGKVTVEAGATLQPGLGGTDTTALTIANNVGLAGTTLIGINRTNASNSARLVVTGTLTNGGTLTVTNVGSELEANDTFTLFTLFAVPSGNFSATNLPPLGAGTNWWTAVQDTTNVVILVNAAPTAGTATYTRAAGVGIKNISIADVLTNVTNVSVGQTITLVGIGSGSQGATITTNGSFIQYSPAAGSNSNDSFTYTVSDGRGGTATGNIAVNVIAVTGQDTGVVTVSNNVATSIFAGIPDWVYVVQRSTNLTDWVNISTNTTPASGLITNVDNFSDLNPPPYPSSAYYRLQSQ